MLAYRIGLEDVFQALPHKLRAFVRDEVELHRLAVSWGEHVDFLFVNVFEFFLKFSHFVLISVYEDLNAFEENTYDVRRS